MAVHRASVHDAEGKGASFGGFGWSTRRWRIREAFAKDRLPSCYDTMTHPLLCVARYGGGFKRFGPVLPEVVQLSAYNWQH